MKTFAEVKCSVTEIDFHVTVVFGCDFFTLHILYVINDANLKYSNATEPTRNKDKFTYSELSA